MAVGNGVNIQRVVTRVLGVQHCSASHTVGVSVVATVLDATNMLSEAECARVMGLKLDYGIDKICSNRVVVNEQGEWRSVLLMLVVTSVILLGGVQRWARLVCQRNIRAHRAWCRGQTKALVPGFQRDTRMGQVQAYARVNVHRSSLRISVIK
jgi:hypothetical protein